MEPAMKLFSWRLAWLLGPLPLPAAPLAAAELGLKPEARPGCLAAFLRLVRICMPMVVDKGSPGPLVATAAAEVEAGPELGAAAVLERAEPGASPRIQPVPAGAVRVVQVTRQTPGRTRESGAAAAAADALIQLLS